MNKKRIVFLTGSRADYGKLKPIISEMTTNDSFIVFVFICGIHLSEEYGNTYLHVQNDFNRKACIAYGSKPSKNATDNFSVLIKEFSDFIKYIDPDLIFVHGDRPEALAGATVGVLNNCLVAHIEGGEITGAIDESIRFSITMLSHVHFVCNKIAYDRLIKIGEEQSRIFDVGFSAYDIMMGGSLPNVDLVRLKYGIQFDNYAILIYHPVTTELQDINNRINSVVDAVIESMKNYIVIYPNDDLGSEEIIREYRRMADVKRFVILTSLQFEDYLSLLKNAEFIIGNSSSGIIESGIFGVPSIDIGSRQTGRYSLKVAKNIQHVEEDKSKIISTIANINTYRYSPIMTRFENCSKKICCIVSSEEFWKIRLQKKFTECITVSY